MVAQDQEQPADEYEHFGGPYYGEGDGKYRDMYIKFNRAIYLADIEDFIDLLSHFKYDRNYNDVYKIVGDMYADDSIITSCGAAIIVHDAYRVILDEPVVRVHGSFQEAEDHILVESVLRYERSYDTYELMLQKSDITFSLMDLEGIIVSDKPIYDDRSHYFVKMTDDGKGYVYLVNKDELPWRYIRHLNEYINGDEGRVVSWEFNVNIRRGI
jgi:hypothetical protein